MSVFYGSHSFDIKSAKLLIPKGFQALVQTLDIILRIICPINFFRLLEAHPEKTA